MSRQKLRRISETTIVILVIALLVVSSSAQTMSIATLSSHGTINRMLWLEVDGQNIIDEDGNVMALRGLAAQWNGYVYNLEGIKNKWIDRLEWMNQNGYTCVRLRIDFNDPQFNVEWLDEVIDLFESHGVYIVLSCIYGYDLQTYYDDGSWIPDWVDLAERYKNRSVIAAYELANEGFFTVNGDPAPCRQAFKECISAVRQVDDKHILIVYETVRSWRAVEMCFQGVSWYQDDVLWRLDDLPADDNIAFKFGYHWTVIRQQSPGDAGYDYYADKFDISEAYASNYVDCLVKWREAFNMPVLNYEFGDYDDDSSHANYAGWKEVIRLCNEQSIPWNYHWIEHWQNYYPSTWKTLVPGFAGSYATQYFDEPQTFNPNRFNLFERISDYYLPYSIYGPGKIWLLDSNYEITINGPCTLRIRSYSGYPDERYLTNVLDDNIVTVNAGQNLTIQGESGKNIIINPYSTN